MAKKKRYYIKPSLPGTHSYSVFERGRKNEDGERFCVVPMVTLYEAKQCCRSLNSGRGAWDWEHDSLGIVEEVF